MNKIILATLLSLTCSLCFAGNYKWKDKEGKTIYGEFPPPGMHAERINTIKASSTAEEEIKAFEEKQKADLEAQEKEVEEQRLAKQKLQQKKIWKANCQAAKRKLASLKEKPKVRKRDAFGQLAVMPEEELAAKIKEAKGEVDIFCKPLEEAVAE